MAELASLTFPRYRRLLNGVHDRATPVIFEEAGQPVGLALLFRADSPEGTPPDAQLLSIGTGLEYGVVAWGKCMSRAAIAGLTCWAF